MKKMLTTILWSILAIIGPILLIYALGIGSLALGFWDPFHDPRVKEVDAIVAGTKQDTRKADVMRMVSERYHALGQPDKAAVWQDKAIAAGDMLAMYDLMHASTTTTRANSAKAADLKARILASKDDHGIKLVAERIVSENTTRETDSSLMTANKVQALDFYLASTKLGNVEAMNKLADIYKQHGDRQEVDQLNYNPPRSYKLLKKADMPDWHIPGVEEEDSYKQALYWYTRAAEKGGEQAMWAQEALGRAYDYKGDMGLPPDREKAIYWYKKSAAHATGRMTNYAKERLKELQP